MTLKKQQNMQFQIEEDLYYLLRKLNANVLDVKKIGTIFSNILDRGSFRIELEDGRVFKARFFPSVEEAKNVWQLSHFLPNGRFPKTFSHYGKVILLEWIRGNSLSIDCKREDIFIEAGLTQRTLHEILLPKHMYLNDLGELNYWQNRLAWKIDNLKSHKLISSSEAIKLMQMAKLKTFEILVTGLTHGDFCHENILIDGQSDLYAIDIETLAVTAIVYDIARTIYRWPMIKKQRNAYLDGYGKSPSLTFFLNEPSFWLILVIAESVLFRYRAGVASVNEPLSKLKNILEIDCSNDLLKFI